MTQDYAKELKISIIGPAAVGKTYLVNRWVKANKSEEINTFSTIGVMDLTKNVLFNSRNFLVKVRDTAGQERFAHDASATFYVKDQDAAIITFAVDDIDSFTNIDYYFDIVQGVQDPPRIMVLVGNKCDVETRYVSRADAEKKAREKQIPYFETSAKNNEKVDDLFDYLIDAIVNNEDHRPQSINLAQEKKESNCC